MNRTAAEEYLIWNTDLPACVDASVHEIIEERCREDPSAVAIVAPDGTFTYEELSLLSSHLAARLVARNLPLESFIPLCLRKSRWTPVAFLGVMKAGAAFLLLDLTLPVARLQTMCRVVDAPFILCSQETTTFAGSLGWEVLVIPEDLTEGFWKAPCGQPCLPNVPPTRALYVVFTSGSTGTPKGTVNDHRGYATSGVAINRVCKIGPGSRVLQFSAYAFDASILEMVTPLMAGACICMLGESHRTDGFLDMASRLHITHACLTPTFVRSLPPRGLDRLDRLHTLLLIGEQVMAPDLSCCSSAVQLMNAYGPAECAVVTTIHSALRTASTPGDIGTPIAAACWVVNNRLEPVPSGTTGELLIEGWTVGREYLDNAEQTARTFIHPPIWLQDLRHRQGKQPARLYRTGDRVCLVDGSLQYRGRQDNQVKIRGQRLELGEVEFHVQGCFDDVASQVVVERIVPDHAPESPYLAAFLVMTLGESATDLENTPFLVGTEAFHAIIARAKPKLAQMLPTYMRPFVFLPLRSMPHTVSGKADRRRLRACLAALSPRQIYQYRTGNSGLQPALTGTAKALQRIWAQELSVPSEGIGLDDNFFDLGGDSITAMRLAATARALGLPLTVGDIMARPTIGALMVTEKKIPAVPVVDQTPFSLVGGYPEESVFTRLRATGHLPQAGDVVDMLPLTAHQQYVAITMPKPSYFCFTYHHPIDVTRLRHACEAVIAKYPILRTVFVPYANELVQVVLDQLALPFAHMSPDQDIEAFVAADRDACTWLEGVPLKFILIANPRPTFIIRISHLQYDGFSMVNLLQDMRAAYRDGQTLAPAPSFSTYLYYRTQYKLAEGYNFWRGYLQDAPVTSLRDMSRPRASVDVVEPFEVRPPAGRSSAHPVPPKGITLPTLLMTAWSVALGEATNQTDVVIGQLSLSRGLPIPAVDAIVGPCYNMVPLRVKWDSTWSVQDLLRQVHKEQKTVSEYDYFDLPEIIRQCTAWPVGTDLDCRFLHNPECFDLKIPLQDSSPSIRVIEPYYCTERQVWAITSVQDGQLHLSVTVPKVPYMVEKATRLATSLQSHRCPHRFLKESQGLQTQRLLSCAQQPTRGNLGPIDWPAVESVNRGHPTQRLLVGHDVSHQSLLHTYRYGIVEWHVLAATLANFGPLVWRLDQLQPIFPAVSSKTRWGSSISPSLTLPLNAGQIIEDGYY
ncbi:hypothetical protein BJX99DRAFT_260879 [Aspergillus californicus]